MFSRYFILKILQMIFWVIDRLIFAAIGYSLTHGSKQEKSLSKKYESSAHVTKVLYRAVCNGETDIWEWDEHNSNMLCLHVQYSHPKCVLEDNVSLFALVRDRVYFAVSPSHTDIYSSDVNSFVVCSQFWGMTHLISMPLTSFHQIAGMTGEPRCQVIMLSHTGRCGSTLAVQCFEALPNTRAISEPLPFVNALKMYNAGLTTDEENRKLIRSIILLLCKQEKEKDIKRVLIKVTSICALFMEIISKCCGFVQHLFLYRHPQKCILSYITIFRADPKFTLNLYFALDPKHKIKGFKWENDVWENDVSQMHNERFIYEFFSFHWCVIFSFSLECRKKGILMKHFSYEEMVNNSRETVSSLFDFLGISDELVPLALTAMKKDSQRNSYVNRERLKQFKVISFTPDQRDLVNRVLQKFGFPPLSEFAQSCFNITS